VQLNQILLLLSALALFAAPAMGEEEAGDEAEPLWEVALASYIRSGPAYPASDETQTDFIPLPFPIYRGKFLRVGDSNEKPITARMFRRDRIKLDLDFGLNLPVDSDDIDAREGMDDLDLLFEVGPELELQFVENLPGEFFLGLQLRGAWSFDSVNPEWRGSIYSAELKHEYPQRDAKTKLVTRLTPEYANTPYMRYFYGVSEKFATPDRPAYDASGGYLGTRLNFSFRHQLSKQFELRTGMRFGFYNGAENEDSPLFTTKSTEEVYFAFMWKFWESKRRAEEK
jgi:outer membrane protein